ncbi:PSP1 C-terminal domain-containing protein [Paludisphaera sp.]|uniref:PSP1 C-terminal domain-containing protein n=1 Tax=Paludisphaera sp. TaxID=2017432 RepID=UPI00301DA5EC
MDAVIETGTGVECLVRHGLAGRVGWFAADAPAPTRGEAVVLRTSRGIELGEVLKAEPSRARAGEDSIGVFRVLRAATPADLELAREAERLRDARFDLCRRVVDEEGWPLELVDVEPLLDLSTVLHVLSWDEYDPAMVRARFRVSGDFDVHVEALGDDPAPDPAPEPPKAKAKAGGGCGTGSGCSSCGVAAMRAGNRPGA